MARSGSISVVITTYNDGEHLKDCLASVAAQTLPADQVIVIDDGSTAAGAKTGIAEALALFPSTEFVRQSNAGPSAARNRGLAECRGDSVAFLDVDDRWTPDNLALKMSLFDAPEVVGAYGGYVASNAAGAVRRSRFRDYSGVLDPALIGRPDGVPGGLPLYLFRTQALRGIGALDESLTIMEDFDALIRLGRKGGIFRGCNAPVYLRTIRKGSQSRGSAWKRYRSIRGFLRKAGRERYFSRKELARRNVLELLALARSALLRR